jgi:hypothetical protein
MAMTFICGCYIILCSNGAWCYGVQMFGVAEEIILCCLYCADEIICCAMVFIN